MEEKRILKLIELDSYLTFPNSGELGFTKNIKEARTFNMGSDLNKCIFSWEWYEICNNAYTVEIKTILV